MFSKTALSLFFFAVLSAPIASAAKLRGSKEESRRNLKVSKMTECTLMVVSDLRAEGVSEDMFDDEAIF